MRHRPFLVPKRPKDRRALDEKGPKRLQLGRWAKDRDLAGKQTSPSMEKTSKCARKVKN